MLSIIIPTLNEENYIGKLLNSIKKQKYKCEIIVVDGNSEDKTKQIVKEYKKTMPHVKLFLEPRRGVALQRNIGAKKAKYDRILFLDADVVLPKSFLKNILKELELKKFDLAMPYAIPNTNNVLDKLSYWAVSTFNSVIHKFRPQAPGFCLFSRKKIHNKIKGFDSTIKLSEDFDYVKRASKFSKFGILKSSKIIVSSRRFEKEGRLKMMLKYFLAETYRLFIGEIRTEIFDYKFDNYKNK